MGMGTAAAAEARRALGWLPWLLLALTWFACVQLRPLLDPDEGRYAEVPREMVLSGDWVTPRLDGVHYFEKPPLQYWATAAAYRVFGQSEWTARLWTVGLAFLCLPLVYGWAARLSGGDRRAGLAALVALATSPLFVLIGHLNMLDAGFTFWLSAALCAFTLAQRPQAGEHRLRWGMRAAWAAAALAVLTKGIVVGVLFGGSLAVYCALERDARLLRRLKWRDGLLTFLALAAPWFLWVSVRNPGFATFFFVHEHFTRFLTQVHHHGEPWWYFLPVLGVGVLPWALPLARAARHTWLADGSCPGQQLVELRPLKFLLVFAGVTLVFFSLSGSKLPPYILPMLPALAVIAGVHAAGSPGFFRRAARWGAAVVALSAAGLLGYCVHRNGYLPAVVTLWTGSALAAVLAAVVLTWPQRERPRWAQGAGPALVTAAASVIAWQGLLNAYTFMPAMRSARDLVAAVRPYVHPGTALYSVGQYRETIPPYLKRRLAVVDFQGELEFPQEPAEAAASTSALADFGGMSHAEFTRSWSASGDALAFFDPKVWDRYHRAGFPGRVVAADAYTVAVVRS